MRVIVRQMHASNKNMRGERHIIVSKAPSLRGALLNIIVLLPGLFLILASILGLIMRIISI